MSPSRSILRLVTAFALVASLLTVVPAQAGHHSVVRRPCDPLDKALCMLPFPNDRFTRSDHHAATGKRIDFQVAEMPRGLGANPIDPTEWNRNDGFSPGSMLLTFVPGLDLHQTWGTTALSTGGANDPADQLSNIGRYAADDVPILVIDATTGERWPFWSELDNNAGTAATERLLIVRPARNFLEGHRYLVGLRNMRDASGAIIPAAAQFAAYRDGTSGPIDDPTFEEARRSSVDGIIGEIASAEAGRGFDRSDLYLAWDFTVASADNLAGRVLHIRDDAFGRILGDTNLTDGDTAGVAPSFTIKTKTEITTDSRKQRQIDGTITVPNYLVSDGTPAMPDVDNPVQDIPGQSVPGDRFLYGLDGLPMQNPSQPTSEIPFVCTIPKTATAASPAHPYQYGHGLLGSRGESSGGSSDRLRERNFMPCAVNWMGFAEYDIAGALVTLVDPSNMPSMIDRSQQGFLNQMFLGRALKHPAGFASNAAFQDAEGDPLFRSGELFYDGNSQGGIMGGALTALSPDFTRATLGVLGMNYSTLLNRSVDWEGPLVNTEDVLPSYSSFLYTMFPNKQEQQLVMAILQMLWDRGEGDGYAQHMTSSPLPNTPAHQVLLHAAFGDFQVTNFSAEVEARTVGARVMDTALMPGRNWSTVGFWGLPSWPRNGDGSLAPWNGSGLVYWDSGNLPPPNANVPPSEEGGDPHEDPRRDPRSGDMRATFFTTGLIVDQMNGGPYLLCRPGEESHVPRVQSQFGTFDWCV